MPSRKVNGSGKPVILVNWMLSGNVPQPSARFSRPDEGEYESGSMLWVDPPTAAP